MRNHWTRILKTHFGNVALILDWRWTADPPERKVPVRLGGGALPAGEIDVAKGRWHRAEITRRGDRVTVVVDGKTVAKDAPLAGAAASGPIALSEEGVAVEFANIFVRPLKGSQR